MLTIRTAAEIKAEVAKLPALSPDLFAKFVQMECIFEAGRVKGYLRGKCIALAPTPLPYADAWSPERFDRNKAIDARIAALGDMVRKRLERETA